MLSTKASINLTSLSVDTICSIFSMNKTACVRFDPNVLHVLNVHTNNEYTQADKYF